MPLEPSLLLLALLAYVFGSIPFGLLVGKARGIDVRTAGSGNIGATNVGRLLGRRYFWIVFALDLLKGMLPMLAASLVVRRQAGGADERIGAHLYWLWLGVGAAAILGHMFSLFLRFRGGKGVATSAGIGLGLYPYLTFPALVGLGTFALVFRLTRIVSISSILAALVFPVAFLGIGLGLGWPVLDQQLPLLMLTSLLALLIVVRHRANIARLRAGTEKPSR